MSLSDARWRAPRLALVAAATLVWAGTVRHHALDPDESQHLHAAWLVSQGRVPFADFWEHHSPLLYYLLAPLTAVMVDEPGVYFAARLVMAALGVAALTLVYRLAARLSRATALAAVTLLAFLPRFVEHATIVRPDVPALGAWLGAVLALVRWRETGEGWRLWLAGMALGLALAFTPKTAYAAPGVALVVALAERGRGPGAAGRVLAGWSRLAAGAGVPLLALVAAMWLHGGAPALDGFAEHVLARSLDFEDFTREAPVGEAGAGFLALALAGVGLAGWRARGGVLDHPVHGPLLLPVAATATMLLLPTTPAVYRHAWLPVLAGLGVYAGLAVAAAAPSRRLTVLAVAVGLLVPAAGAARNAVVDRNRTQLAVMRRQLAWACPGEAVLDGTALYVFRPAAYRYQVLIRGIRRWIAEGVIPEERLVDDVRRAAPRVAYEDFRLRGLVGPMADFLARHYVALPDGFLVVGAAVRLHPPRDEGRAEIDLLVAGAYQLTASPGVEVALDGRALRPGIQVLDAGVHAIRWTGPVGTIELTALDCAGRRALSR